MEERLCGRQRVLGSRRSALAHGRLRHVGAQIERARERNFGRRGWTVRIAGLGIRRPRLRRRMTRRSPTKGFTGGEPETMIGGGNGRSAGAAAGAFATTGAFATAGALATLGASGAWAVSGARGEASPLARRRSIAARARSLASRRSSGAAAVSTGAAGAAATTGAAERRHGLHGRRQYDPDLFLFARDRCMAALVGARPGFRPISHRAWYRRTWFRRTWYRVWRQPLLRLSLQSSPGPFRPPPAVRPRSSP